MSDPCDLRIGNSLSLPYTYPYTFLTLRASLIEFEVDGEGWGGREMERD